jgi:hypothetical protein
MLNPLYIFAGFLVGMLITTVFIPPTLNQKMMPDPARPNMVFKNPKVENGFFNIRSIEVPCTGEVDSLNLMSMLDK